MFRVKSPSSWKRVARSRGFHGGFASIGGSWCCRFAARARTPCRRASRETSRRASPGCQDDPGAGSGASPRAAPGECLSTAPGGKRDRLFARERPREETPCGNDARIAKMSAVSEPCLTSTGNRRSTPRRWAWTRENAPVPAGARPDRSALRASRDAKTRPRKRFLAAGRVRGRQWRRMRAFQVPIHRLESGRTHCILLVKRWGPPRYLFRCSSLRLAEAHCRLAHKEPVLGSVFAPE